jgi:GNAT superfamily N-acetyltransferase
MTSVQVDLAAGALARAVEENTAEFLLELGRVGGGEQRAGAEVSWTLGGSPIGYHNAVVRAGLAGSGGRADAVVAESVEVMRRHGVPGCWHVGPSMRPADLGERLLAAGFRYDGEEPGMAADLHELREPRRPDGLSVERVCDEAGLAAWERTLPLGFGEGERESRWVAAMYRRLGYAAEGGPWLHFLARLDGEPVGTCTVYLGAGVAGLYFVMVVPERRGAGIGAAVTAAALRYALGLGYRVGVLGSSEMGRSVYARLGFREYLRTRLYEWEPAVA